MNEPRCQFCGEVVKPYERVTNRKVSDAAKWPGPAGLAIRWAIFPDLPETCPDCGRRPPFEESGQGADWRVECCSLRRAGENKPGGAPIQDSPVSLREYEQVFDGALTVPDAEWAGIPPAWHAEPHSWTEDCVNWCKLDHGTTRLVLPQVLVYRLRTGLPCTLITDRGDDATEVYTSDERFGYSIADGVAPIRTVPEVLNTFASLLAHISLSDGQRELAHDIATRLWWRSPWSQEPVLTAGARALVRPAAYRCAQGECRP